MHDLRAVLSLARARARVDARLVFPLSLCRSPGFLRERENVSTFHFSYRALRSLGGRRNVPRVEGPRPAFAAKTTTPPSHIALDYISAADPSSNSNRARARARLHGFIIASDVCRNFPANRARSRSANAETRALLRYGFPGIRTGFSDRRASASYRSSYAASVNESHDSQGKVVLSFFLPSAARVVSFSK